MNKEKKTTSFELSHQSDAVRRARASDRDNYAKTVERNKTNRANVSRTQNTF